MKKIIALVLLAGAVFASDYTVNITVPVKETVEQVVQKSVTTATVENISISLVKDAPIYFLRITLKDEEENIIERKTVRLTHVQMQKLMPSIDTVMAGCQQAVQVNMSTLLAM